MSASLCCSGRQAAGECCLGLPKAGQLRIDLRDQRLRFSKVHLHQNKN
jgi:hypothetical protein